MDKLVFDNNLSQEEKIHQYYFRGNYYRKMGDYIKALEYY